jgi:hypothetical protein
VDTNLSTGTLPPTPDPWADLDIPPELDRRGTRGK